MRRHVLKGAAVAVAAAATTPAAAQDARASVDATVSSGVSGSPFLLQGDGRSSVYVEGVVSPQLTFIDELGNSSISGFVRGVKYFDGYDTSWSLGASAQSSRAMTETLTLRGAIQVNSSILGERGANGLIATPVVTPDAEAPDGAPATGVTAPPVPVTPVVALPTPIGPDITLLGFRRRQTSFGGSAGLSYRTSPRSSLNVDGNVQRASYGGRAFNYTSYGATVGWSRSLSELTSVGWRVSGQWSDYDSGGSGQVYQPQLTIDTRISTRWRLSGGAGLLFTRSRTIVERDSSTGVSVNAQLCRDGLRSNLCFAGNRDAGPNGLGAVSRRLSGSVNYSYRLNATDSLNTSADYSRVSGGQRLLLNDELLLDDGLLFDSGNFSYVSARASWDHRLLTRLTGGLSLSYRDSLGGDSFNRPADFSASIFFRTRFGNLQ